MTNRQGLLIVYSGPSGVGKGTLIGPIFEEADMTFSVSLTTRTPRADEVEGKNYYFVSQEIFEAMVDEGGLLEYARYNQNYYGTPRRYVEDTLRSGRDVVLEIDVQGAMQIKQSYPSAVFIFVLPPNVEVLRQRLAGRGTESDEDITRRMEVALSEIAMSEHYDYIIVNDDIDIARAQLRAIIEASRVRAPQMKYYVDEVLKV